MTTERNTNIGNFDGGGAMKDMAKDALDAMKKSQPLLYNFILYEAFQRTFSDDFQDWYKKLGLAMNRVKSDG